MRWMHVVRFGWILGFAVGTATHVVDLVVGGLAVYAAYPLVVQIFWVSLTLLDPLTAVLVAARRRAGVVIAVVVMVADVVVNVTVFATIGGLAPLGIALQVLFATFVVGTAPLLWRADGARAHAALSAK